MISIVIPVYNQADKIGKCLNSLAKQTYRDYEIIVVNDGSTDDLETVLQTYKQTLSLKIINQANQGANVARNRGAKEATGDYLLFCDADLMLQPTMLEKMFNTLQQHPEISYVYSSFKFGAKTFRLFPFDEARLKQMPYIHTTSLMRAKDFPGFDEKLKKFQDWDLWLTMLEQGKRGLWLDEILFQAIGGGTMSNWLPSFAYKLMPRLKSVKKYNEAMEIIKTKHRLA